MKNLNRLKFFWLILSFIFTSFIYAEVLLNDDFEDDSLGTVTWIDQSSGGGTVAEANGLVTIQANGLNNSGKVISYNSVTLGAGQTVVLSTTDMEFQSYAANSYWGLTDETGENQIALFTGKHTANHTPAKKLCGYFFFGFRFLQWRFPIARQQFINLVGWMSADFPEYVIEIGKWVMAHQFATCDQAINNSCSLCTSFAASKHIITASNYHHSQSSL